MEILEPRHPRAETQCEDALPVEYELSTEISLSRIWESAGSATLGANFLSSWAIFMIIISQMHGPSWCDLWSQNTFDKITQKLAASSDDGEWALRLIRQLGFMREKFEPIYVKIESADEAKHLFRTTHVTVSTEQQDALRNELVARGIKL